MHGKLVENLRYGENPHQESSLYTTENNLNLKKLMEKILVIIITMIFILHFQFQILLKKKKELVIIIKHANPCGVSTEKIKFFF